MTLVKKIGFGLASALILLAFTAGFAAAPIQFDAAGISTNAAWAKHGADDPGGHNAGDDRGRKGGRDDGANHR